MPPCPVMPARCLCTTTWYGDINGVLDGVKGVRAEKKLGKGQKGHWETIDRTEFLANINSASTK